MSPVIHAVLRRNEQLMIFAERPDDDQIGPYQELAPTLLALPNGLVRWQAEHPNGRLLLDVPPQFVAALIEGEAEEASRILRRVMAAHLAGLEQVAGDADEEFDTWIRATNEGIVESLGPVIDTEAKLRELLKQNWIRDAARKIPRLAVVVASIWTAGFFAALGLLVLAVVIRLIAGPQNGPVAVVVLTVGTVACAVLGCWWAEPSVMRFLARVYAVRRKN